MKRFLLVCLGLLAVAVLLMAGYDYVNLILVRGCTANSAGKIERIFSSDTQDEIALFGSSRALGNYCPSMIASGFYDYGMNGQGMTETLFLVREYLKRHHPRMVLIDISPWGFDDPAKAKYVGDYRLVGTDKAIRKLLPYGLLLWADWLPGIRFQGNLRKALTQYVNERRATTKKIDCGAEILLNSRTDKEWKVIDNELYDYDFKFSPDSQRLIDEVYAVQGDARVVWIVSPVAPNMRTRFKGEARLQEFLKEQVSRPKVYAYSCLDRTDEFRQELFVDHRHLNIRGAEKFSVAVKEFLGLEVLQAGVRGSCVFRFRY